MVTEAEKKGAKATEESRVMIARIDERTEFMHEDIKELKVQVAKINGRVRKLEVGFASLVSILAGAGILDATVFHRVIGG